MTLWSGIISDPAAAEGTGHLLRAAAVDRTYWDPIVGPDQLIKDHDTDGLPLAATYEGQPGTTEVTTFLDPGWGNDPQPVQTQLVFRASSKIVELEQVLTNTTGFDTLGGVVTTPTFFVANPAMIVGRCVGAFKAVGTGAQLQILEILEDGTVNNLTPTPFDIPDSADEWKNQGFNIQVPPSAGMNRYLLEGKLNGATSASVEFVSMSIMEIVTYQ